MLAYSFQNNAESTPNKKGKRHQITSHKSHYSTSQFPNQSTAWGLAHTLNDFLNLFFYLPLQSLGFRWRFFCISNIALHSHID